MKLKMKYLLLFNLINLFFIACSNITPIIPQKEIKESNVSPACRSNELSPLMVCGEYVIVKGKLNSSNNLERLNRGTMYMSESLTKEENRDVIDKNILLSGKCSSEVISGGGLTMVYLNDAKLLQIVDNENINKTNMIQTCEELKNQKKR